MCWPFGLAPPGYGTLPRFKQKRGFLLMQNTVPRNKIISPAQPTGQRTRRLDFWRILRRLAFLITPLTVLTAWYLVTEFELVRPFLLPTPEAVLERFQQRITDGDRFLIDSTLWGHTMTTLTEVVLGLGIGAFIGIVAGYAIAKNRLLETLLSPIVIVFQSTPIVAYAPLLVIWFDSGIQSKVVTCVLVVFFPILMNTVTGLRSVPDDLRDLMRVSNASWWQTFIKLEVPASLPVMMTGLKTGATLAVIGAVVGEFVEANAGLGFLLNLARQQYDTPLVFVAAITLAIMAGTLYLAVTLLERRLLRWQRN